MDWKGYGAWSQVACLRAGNHEQTTFLLNALLRTSTRKDIPVLLLVLPFLKYTLFRRQRPILKWLHQISQCLPSNIKEHSHCTPSFYMGLTLSHSKHSKQWQQKLYDHLRQPLQPDTAYHASKLQKETSHINSHEKFQNGPNSIINDEGRGKALCLIQSEWPPNTEH